MDWVSLISAVGGLLIGGGGVLFYRQNKAAKVIDNESRLALEWEKLYQEQKTKREENSAKLEKLADEVARLRAEVEMLKADKSTLQHYKCINIDCDKRNPPINNN